MSLSPEQEQKIRNVLTQLNYSLENSEIKVEGESRTGVMGKSTVYQIKILRPLSADSLDLIVKFDQKERMEKEVAALRWLSQGNRLYCVLYNLDGPGPLAVMEAHELILYPAADAHAPGHELLDLETLLKRQCGNNQANCQKAMELTLEGLAEFHSNKPETCHDSWFKYFEKVYEKLPELREQLNEPLCSALAQIGIVGWAPMGKIHGDLNLSNIIVTMKHHAPTHVSLIDFAEARRGAPICIDLARLELALWLDVVPFEHHRQLAQDLDQGKDLKGLAIPGLETVLALKGTLERHVATLIDGYWTAYRMPLLLWCLRALSFETVTEQSKALVRALAVQAWRAIERERSGRQGTPSPPEPAQEQPRPSHDAELMALVEAKITALLERDCWRACWHSLARDLAHEEHAMPANIARHLMTLDLAEVSGKLIAVFDDARDQISPWSWEAGMELLSWLVILRVKSLAAADLADLPVTTLLGTELVMAKHNNRRMMAEDRSGRMVGERALDVYDAGPIKSDWVRAVSEQLRSFSKGSEIKDIEKLEGRCKTAAIAKQPYYVVVDGPQHPLASEQLCGYIKRYVPSLVIVRMRREVAADLRLVAAEEQLEGHISEYLQQQRDWERRYYRGGNRD